MKRPEPASPGPAGARLTALLVVLVLFFALPAALFIHLIGGEEVSQRMAAMILALTLPATGSLILRLNPDLVPDRAGLRALPALEWARLAVLAALLLGALWWVVTVLGP